MDKKIIISFVILIFCGINNIQKVYSQSLDIDRLGMAIEYFQSGKYHEALLIFQKLDKLYELNSRFRAYIGVCYYYECDYENACKYLDEMIPKLVSFAPHERSIYYYTDSESHFYLNQYDKAIPLYEQMLLICYENEKPEVLYRIGMCYLFNEDWSNARDYFNSALSYYLRYRNTPEEHARIAQIENMLKGCTNKLQKK